MENHEPPYGRCRSLIEFDGNESETITRTRASSRKIMDGKTGAKFRREEEKGEM